MRCANSFSVSSLIRFIFLLSSSVLTTQTGLSACKSFPFYWPKQTDRQTASIRYQLELRIESARWPFDFAEFVQPDRKARQLAGFGRPRRVFGNFQVARIDRRADAPNCLVCRSPFAAGPQIAHLDCNFQSRVDRSKRRRRRLRQDTSNKTTMAACCCSSCRLTCGKTTTTLAEDTTDNI